MKKLLIAIDTSPSAEEIAKIGYRLGQDIKAEVTLVHVVNDFEYYNFDYDPIMGYKGYLVDASVKVMTELKTEANVYLNHVKVHLGDSSIKTHVLNGITYEKILDFANSNNFKMIVLGTHSHSTLDNILMGNVTVKIVKHSKIPLLIIPTGY